MTNSVAQLMREHAAEKKAKKETRKLESQLRKLSVAEYHRRDSSLCDGHKLADGNVSVSVTSESVKLLSMDELQSGFVEAIAGVASNLYRAAVLYTEIKRRGGDVPQVYSELKEFLPDIATGRLAPEMFPAVHDKKILRNICGLPLGEQRRLATGGTVEVVMNERGETMQVGIKSLAANEVLARRVFRYGEIVPVDQQIANIAGEIEAKKPPKQRVVKIVRTEVGQGPYREIEPEAFSRGEVASVVVHLYPGELENFKSAAKSAGMSESEYARRALHEGGLLKRHKI